MSKFSNQIFYSFMHHRFEKKRGPTADFEYNICGYVSVYHYYAYPSNMRPRIR